MADEEQPHGSSADVNVEAPLESTDVPAAAPAAADAALTVEDAEAEIEAIRARVAEMEEEAKRMTEAAGGGAADGNGSVSGSPQAAAGGRVGVSSEQSAEQDSRSIHVAQVDYSVSEDELRRLFEACGSVVRTTILKDKFSGQPKGFAYIEFASPSAIANAMILNETEFKGRTLKITPKRTNIPGFNRGRGRGGARGGARGGSSGGYAAGGYDAAALGGSVAGAAYGPVRGRGGRGRGGRGRGGYHPYQQQQQYQY